jgi:hypothetical protein
LMRQMTITAVMPLKISSVARILTM